MVNDHMFLNLFLAKLYLFLFSCYINTDIDKHFQAAFQCSGLVCGDMNTPDEDLIQKAFEYAHDEVLDKNKETIYDMLYSSNFLNWLLKLKKSNDTLDPSNRIV